MAYQLRGKRFEEFEVGDEFVTASRTITEGDVILFAGLSGDFNPLHMDEEHAKSTQFGGRIAHGLLGVAVASGLANQLGIFEGTTHALLSMNVRYTGAVRFGDTLSVRLRVKDKKETSKEDRGIVVFEATVLNQREEPVVESEWTLLMARGGDP